VTANARRAPRAAGKRLAGKRLAGRALACGVTAVLLSSALGCAGHSDALARGQRYYEDNQYERALALWRDLDRRGARFSAAERVRYAYFRGMTDYRLGYRDDARHWLAIARAADAARPGGLDRVWLERLDSALTDLGRTPSRSGGGAADVVQTIEAPPGVPLPDEASLDDPPGEMPPGATRPGEVPSGVSASGEVVPATPPPRALPADAGAVP
jgi:hypothetical protein